MEGVACNQDYEELELLLNEIPKTPSDSSIQETTNSPSFFTDFRTNGKHLPALNLPDEESLASAFTDLSFRDHMGSASSSWGPVRDSSSGVNYGGTNHNGPQHRNTFSSHNLLTKSNSSLFEGSKLQNMPVHYMCNVPVNSGTARRPAEAPVSRSPLMEQLYDARYELTNRSDAAWREMEAEMHSRNLMGLQNRRQNGLSIREMYWRNTQLNNPDYHQSSYPYGYNSEMLIGRGEPCRVQYGERLRHPLFNQPFNERATPRPHGVYPQRISDLAKDQNGCLYLQDLLKEGTPLDIENVFREIIGNIVDLMNDPFGNYLVQMLLERCNEDQKALVVYEITKIPGQLLNISCDMHGTRAVQKVIETIRRSPHLISRVISSLNIGVLDLMMDANGSHVTQRCLQHMDPDYTMFILETALAHCYDLAKNRQGCCVLQKCIHHSSEAMKYQLIHRITSNALILTEDPYGNYVIQYIIEMKVAWMTNRIVNQLDSRFGALSMQKYSSNVVEKLLKLGGEANRGRIIHELVLKPDELLDISLDQFGNYVVQSAVTSSKGMLRTALVETIRPHAPALRNSSYGRRVLARIGLKNK